MKHVLPTLHSTSPEARIAWALAAAGVIPFGAGLGDLIFAGGTWIGQVQIYGAVIASFICGIHWGAALLSPRHEAIQLLVASNVAALSAWAAAMVGPSLGFFLFAILFAALAAIDRRLHRRGIWPGWFWRLRLSISTIVACICLLIGWFA